MIINKGYVAISVCKQRENTLSALLMIVREWYDVMNHNTSL